MIIFDLSSLADDSHRRHLIDASCNPHTVLDGSFFRLYPQYYDHKTDTCIMPCNDWQPDYPAYYAACDGDADFSCVTELWNNEISLGAMGHHQIWTDRPESTRELTEKWLNNKLVCFEPNQLKMRPLGEERPQEQLFEEWADLYMFGELSPYSTLKGAVPLNPIDMVFSSHKPTIEMFRKRGIFVFDCNQDAKEF